MQNLFTHQLAKKKKAKLKVCKEIREDMQRIRTFFYQVDQR